MNVPENVGRARFTVERFLSNCSPATKEYLLENWAESNQLLVEEIPPDGLPPVVILAAFTRLYDVELVDNYDELLNKYWWESPDIFHPDKFFASSVCIMDENGTSPDLESFEAINIPTIYEELFPD